MRMFWRLLGFLRPYRGGVAVSFVLAAAAMGVGVLIPYLVGRTVDEIRGGGVDLWPLALAVAGAGVLRLAFSVSRRLVAGRVSLGVEYDLRNRIYEHLHSLELAFFDAQQTGQLMSRATVDLQSVRFFLGYGLIFIMQSALTLLILIPRLYDVDQGALLVDGVDVRSVDPASLRREVAVVSDDAFLFSASLAENIAYARADASEEEIRAAAERAGLGELLDDLPEGLDTLVGERGLTLSGGQRQRVAIARALLAEPRILILDDATSSVDATTESQIKSALAEVMDGRTTFVIAHRLSTIALADEVVVLEDGEIAARGTHDELLDSSPLYREIAEKGLPDQVFLTRCDPDREVAGL